RSAAGSAFGASPLRARVRGRGSGITSATSVSVTSAGDVSAFAGCDLGGSDFTNSGFANSDFANSDLAHSDLAGSPVTASVRFVLTGSGFGSVFACSTCAGALAGVSTFTGAATLAGGGAATCWTGGTGRDGGSAGRGVSAFRVSPAGVGAGPVVGA